jgi:ribosomal protein L11 methylase PrmA
MNTAAPRWRLFVPIPDESAWELQLAIVMDLPLEAIVEEPPSSEEEAHAWIHFVHRADAERCAELLGVEPIIEQTEPGGGEVFGANGHPTTALCLELAEMLVPPDSLVADIGSGTGILAAHTLTLGARFAVAADIDWPAAVATAELAAITKRSWTFYTPTITTFAITMAAIQGSADALASATFQTIFANLHLGILREVAGELTRIAAPQATIIASGFTEDQSSAVASLLAEFEWKIQDVRVKEGWAAVAAARS